MSDDDTFFGSGTDNERTVLKPQPGVRSRAQAPQTPASPPPPGTPGPLPLVQASDPNPLVAAATPLLSLAGRLVSTVSHSDPDSLFRHVTQEVQGFEAAALGAGVPPDTVRLARYSLCTLLDEVVLNTPWGSQSNWPGQTLLTLFEKEAWGGEKFFQMLERLLQQPAANLDLLELMYLCLSMGLQGQYRVRQDGRSQLEAVRGNLYHTLRTHRGEYEHDLSPRWRGVANTQSPLVRSVPFWAVGAIAAGIALVVYLGFLWSLNRASDPIAVEIAGLGRNLPAMVERQGYVPIRSLSLTDLLQTEIRAGALEVDDRNGRETVTLRALFPSGSADVSFDQQGLLGSVAEALNQLPGQVMVTGHTDDVPSRSLRYPSNWHLSADRAEAVVQILSQYMIRDRLVAEAAADSEPLVPNSTPQNRAINRRVEIALFNAPGRE